MGPFTSPFTFMLREGLGLAKALQAVGMEQGGRLRSDEAKN